MRIRTQLVIDDAVMAKIDEIAGERHRRAIVVETALKEYIERESRKRKPKPAPEADEDEAI